MEIKDFEVGPFAVNTYLVWDKETKQAAIVDPTLGSEAILNYITKEGLTLDYIINTHGHMDHVTRDGYFKGQTKAKLLIHEADLLLLQNSARQALTHGVHIESPPEPDQFVVDGDTIAIGSETMTVLHTPGHSPGGICLYWVGHVLVGDTLFAGSVGRTDFPGCSHEELVASVRAKLFVLPDKTKAYPGHGPATTIGWEKKYNPFFQSHGTSGLWLP